VNNSGTGAEADVVVRETDDLNLVGPGLVSAAGIIDVELAGSNALLTLSSGVIQSSGSAKAIILTADDMNLVAGEDTITGSGTLTIRSKSQAWNYNVGGAGEGFGGSDLTFGPNNNALDLSMTDIASFSDGFTQISIGHRTAGNQLRLGDAEDATTIPSTGEARVVAAAFRDPVRLEAEFVEVVGDAQVIGATLELRGRLLDIAAINMHKPTGEPDSGLYGSTVRLEFDEQIRVMGWVRADSTVRIDVTATTGTNPLQSYPDDVNSLLTDVGSIIETLSGGGSIVVRTKGSIRHASMVRTAGNGGEIDMAAETGFRNLEGALVTAPGDEQLCSPERAARSCGWKTAVRCFPVSASIRMTRTPHRC
jgi:hypothetical protein